VPGDLLSDVMGYCRSSWFGAYNYGYVQQFLENRTAAQTAAAVALQTRAAAMKVADEDRRGYLVLSGRITNEGLTLGSTQVLPTPPIVPHLAGPYTMTIRTVAGQTLLAPFTPSEMGDGPGVSFTVVIPNPGPVASVEVTKAMRVIPQTTKGSRAKTQTVSAAQVRPAVSWLLEPEGISVHWNATAEPTLSITLVHADGRREVIASELGGGDVRIGTGVRAAGSQIELTLGNEFSARTVVAH